MAWIELHQSLPAHPKTLALAERLELKPLRARRPGLAARAGPDELRDGGPVSQEEWDFYQQYGAR